MIAHARRTRHLQGTIEIVTTAMTEHDPVAEALEQAERGHLP